MVGCDGDGDVLREGGRDADEEGDGDEGGMTRVMMMEGLWDEMLVGKGASV